jgi:hypothetical protein
MHNTSTLVASFLTVLLSEAHGHWHLVLFLARLDRDDLLTTETFTKITFNQIDKKMEILFHHKQNYFSFGTNSTIDGFGPTWIFAIKMV